MFFERFEELCTLKGIKTTPACVEIGISRGLAAKWKKEKTERPDTKTLEKIADYFGMSIEEVLNGESEEKKTATIGDDLSAEELDFIRLYSEADEQKKAAIRILLGM